MPVSCRPARWATACLLALIFVLAAGCGDQSDPMRERADAERRFLAQALEELKAQVLREAGARIQREVFAAARTELLSQLRRDAVDAARKELSDRLRTQVKEEVLLELLPYCQMTCAETEISSTR
jgi:hypothetical protein